jgi:hypothetical protein
MFERFERGVVAIGQFEQFLGIGEAGTQFRQGLDDRVQVLFFTSELLGVRGVVPDTGAFQLGVDYLQAFRFGIEVKDTSVAPTADPGSPAGARPVDFDVLLPWFANSGE